MNQQYEFNAMRCTIRSFITPYCFWMCGQLGILVIDPKKPMDQLYIIVVLIAAHMCKINNAT